MTSPQFIPRLQRYGCRLGALLLILSAAAGYFRPADFFAGYLSAFLYWAQIALGGLGLLFLQYLTGGRWGATITRLLEAGALTLPALGLFFVPVLAGMSYLFPWIHPEGARLQQIVAQKALYLNVPFYLARFAIDIFVLSAMALWSRRRSLRGTAEDVAALQKWSGPALIIFVLLMNFAAVDWVMSLKPEWYSSMLSVEFCAEAATAAMAFSIVMLHAVDRAGLRREAVDEKVTHDLGNLLLGFTCFWTYVTFSEYLIIWTGNLPHEISWFVDRSSAGWKAFAVVLVFLHFVLPLFSLILTAVSKKLDRLVWVAWMMLAAHYAQIVWWVGPGFSSGRLPWSSPLLVVAMGLIWFELYVRYLRAAPLLVREVPHPVSSEVAA